MMGSYRFVAMAARGILQEFNWSTISLLYHNHEEISHKGNSDCYFALGGIYRILKNSSESTQEFFDEEKSNRTDYLRIMTSLKQRARSE